MNMQTYYQFDLKGIYIGPLTVPEDAPMPRFCTLEKPLTGPGESIFMAGEWRPLSSLPGEAA